MHIEPRTYYVSDFAYNKLVGIAQRQHFVQFGAGRAKGVSEFLIELSKYPLQDTRPPLVIERQKEEVRNNRAPTWLHVKTRRARLLKLTDDAIARYFLAAFEFGIIRKEPFARGGPDRSTPYPTVSLVIEAIGLGWLTPVELPSR